MNHPETEEGLAFAPTPDLAPGEVTDEKADIEMPAKGQRPNSRKGGRRGLKPFRVAPSDAPASATLEAGESEQDLATNHVLPPVATNGHAQNGHPQNGHDHISPESLFDMPGAGVPLEAEAHTTPDKAAKESNGWEVVLLPMDALVPSPFQSREHFDETELQELAASIKAYGVQQPILVRKLKTVSAESDADVKADAPSKNGKSSKATTPEYELVVGERRWRASRLAGKKVVPAFVRELSDLAAAEIAVIENVQRASLSVIEEARGYRHLALKFRLKEERIAKKVGKSVQTIRDTLRLLALPDSVQRLLAQRKLSAAHGHELLRLAPHPAICEAVALRAVRDRLTATSLAGDILPQAGELVRSGRIIELGYGTRFDWREVCKECPHKAYLRVGYRSYCLLPEEWRAKQEHAIALQQEEAARVLEQARKDSDGTLTADAVSQRPHRSLLHVTPPAGCCESCPCRSEALDEADPMRRYPVCLDPQRFEQLRDAERKANEEARRQKAAQEFEAATRALQGLVPTQDLAVTNDWCIENGVASEGDSSGGGAGEDPSSEDEAVEGVIVASQGSVPSDNVPNDRVAALLVLPILLSQPYGYHSPGFLTVNSWQEFVGDVAKRLEIEVPIQKILDARTSMFEALELLRALPSPQLLLLGASLVLALEANKSSRFGGETPQIDFALGRAPAVQTRFDGEEWGEDDESEAAFDAEAFDAEAFDAEAFDAEAFDAESFDEGIVSEEESEPFVGEVREDEVAVELESLGLESLGLESVALLTEEMAFPIEEAV